MSEKKSNWGQDRHLQVPNNVQSDFERWIRRRLLLICNTLGIHNRDLILQTGNALITQRHTHGYQALIDTREGARPWS